MKQYLVNGFEKDVTEKVENLHDLIDQIRRTYTTENSLISAILINGVELNEKDEQLIGDVPLSALRTVEVFTAHPKEIAEETLQSLVEFTKHLEDLCARVGTSPDILPRVADGITTFIDALDNVKQILRIGILPSVQVLEADLASILKDILEFQQRKEMGSVAAIVKDALVGNLALWRTEGLPNLIRSRDS